MPSENSAPGSDGHELLDRAKDAFLDLIEVEPDARAVRLDRLCGDDEALRRAVVELLEAHDAAGAFLREPSGEAVRGGAAHLPLPPGSRIGPYRLDRVLGEGGFGVVYLAQQEEPIRRSVALKVLKLGMDTERIVARFEVERQTLALMDHPGIARVLDAGTTPRGRPFFVMEFVDGAPITEFCDSSRLDLTARLALFERVCLAVQHAHHKGVIHRDLKPSNVLVKLIDGEAIPKVIDFGVAKAAGGRLGGHTLTGERQVVGTPEYMAPEQTVPAIDGEQDVDTRADVFSLGVILYRLLTGRSPYGSTSFDAFNPDAWALAIREGELPRPSTRLRESGEEADEIAAVRGTTPERLERTLREELDWIVLRAVERDRTRRYQSASALAEDVRHYLLDEPAEAGPPSARYRLVKFYRRNRAAVTSVVAVFVLAVVAAAVSMRAAVVADRERQEARRLQGLAEQRSYVANVFAAEAALMVRDSVGARRRLDATPATLRAWEWRYLDAQIDVSDSVVRRDGSVPATIVTAQGGRYLGVGWRDGAIDVVDTSDGGIVARREGLGTLAHQLAWSRDSEMLFVAFRSGEFFRWRWREDRVDRIPGHDAAVSSIALVPDGSELVSGSLDGTVRLWDLDTAECLVVRDLESGWVPALSISPDGTRIAVGTVARMIYLLDARTLEPLSTMPGHAETVTALAWLPDGSRLVSASTDRMLKLWNPDTGEEAATLRGHTRQVHCVAVSEDGARIFSGGEDCAVRVWAVSR